MSVGLIVAALRDFSSHTGENLSPERDITTIAEASRLVKLAAEPRPVGDKIKAAIKRAATRTRFTYVRTRKLWYAEAKRIDAGELDALRGIERERRERSRAARKEHQAHLEQLAALRARLATRDPDFHRPDIEALDFVQTFLARLPSDE